MTKQITKAIAIVLVVMLMFAVAAPVFAVNPDEFQISTDNAGANKVKEVSGSIIGIVQVIGTAIAIIMLVVLGIKYVMAAPSEKAEIKKSALIYVIAAIFLFAAVQILGIIQDFSDDIFGKSTN